MYNAILLTNKNETKCGLHNKNYAKMSLHLPKRDETKCYNVISSRLFALLLLFCSISVSQGCQVFAKEPSQLLLKTSPIAFRGGFPGKVCIPGAKYHVIGVASTRGHEKQPAGSSGNSVKVAQFRRKTADLATLCADAGEVTSSSPTHGII